jgi:hypothetical protein
MMSVGLPPATGTGLTLAAERAFASVPFLPISGGAHRLQCRVPVASPSPKPAFLATSASPARALVGFDADVHAAYRTLLAEG